MIITHSSAQSSNLIQSVNTLPLPVCAYTRGGFRDRRFPTAATFGHCAAKKLDYYGFKLGLTIARSGMIIHFPLLCAGEHDVKHLGSLIEGFSGTAPADKGFLDACHNTCFARTGFGITRQKPNFERN